MDPRPVLAEISNSRAKPPKLRFVCNHCREQLKPFNKAMSNLKSQKLRESKDRDLLENISACMCRTAMDRIKEK